MNRRQGVVMTQLQMILLISENIPGAIRVCSEIVKNNGKLHLYMLDALEVYGSDLWNLYEDCDKKVPALMQRIEEMFEEKQKT